MKKLFFAIAVIAVSAAMLSFGLSKGGVRLQFTYPVGVTTDRTTLFPTFDYVDAVYDNDTLEFSVNEAETWLKHDSISATTYIIVTPESHVTAGSKLWIQPLNDGTARTVYVKQGANALDTIVVSNNKIKRQYIYNGYLFEVVK